MIEDAFRSGVTLTHTGDFALENTYDGFDRVILATDAAGNQVDTGQDIGASGSAFIDPDDRVIQSDSYGPVGGATPTDRTESGNVLLASLKHAVRRGGHAIRGRAGGLSGRGKHPALRPRRNAYGWRAGGQLDRQRPHRHGHAHQRRYFIHPDPHDFRRRRPNHRHPGRQHGPNDSSSSTGPVGAINVTDALNNVVNNTFDAAGNLIIVHSHGHIARSPRRRVPNETFAAAMYYDCLNQLVLRAYQGADGNLDPNVMGLAAGGVSFWELSGWNFSTSTLISCFAPDSRGNRVLAVDPKGNSSLMVFDGASRTIQTQQHLRQKGQGGNPPAANKPSCRAVGPLIVTTVILDGNSRQTQLIDDRGDITQFAYDTLDREVTMTFHDGSTRTNVYDEAGDVVTYTDENGSVFTNTFDAAGAEDGGRDCARAQALRARPRRSRSSTMASRERPSRQNTDGSNPADVTMVYDSLDRLLEDSQAFDGNTRNVTNTAFTSYPATQFQFPNGRLIDKSFDLLYRRTRSRRIAIHRILPPGSSSARSVSRGTLGQRPDLHLDEQRPHEQRRAVAARRQSGLGR